eukprot:6175832-Pleurochrysis_carterae.AAC.1
MSLAPRAWQHDTLRHSYAYEPQRTSLAPSNKGTVSLSRCFSYVTCYVRLPDFWCARAFTQYLHGLLHVMQHEATLLHEMAPCSDFWRPRTGVCQKVYV